MSSTCVQAGKEAGSRDLELDRLLGTTAGDALWDVGHNTSEPDSRVR